MRATVRSRWTRSILICRKCSKKLGGGFGDDDRMSLAKALARGVGGGRGRKATVGIVPVDCLKLCPKRAVVVVDGAAPGDWLVVEAGTPIADICVRLGLGKG